MFVLSFENFTGSSNLVAANNVNVSPDGLDNTTFHKYQNNDVTRCEEDVPTEATKFGGVVEWLQDYLAFEAVLCSMTVCLGVLSWTLLPKWRQFRNFAFLNLFVADGLYSFLFSSFIHISYEGSLCKFAINVSGIALPIWQVIIAYCFYVNIVKIFSFHSSRIYLYATVWAWAVPSVAALSYGDVDWKYIAYVSIALSIFNLLLYLRVLQVLLSSPKIRSSASSTLGHRIRVATFIFVFSGVLTYIPLIGDLRVRNNPRLESIVDLLCSLQIVVSNVLFLCLKSHRELWLEFVRERRRA